MAKKRNTGGIIFTLVVVAAAAGGGWYYWKSRPSQEPTYTTTRVTTATITQTVTATGDLAMRKEIAVGSLVSGKVEKVTKDFNDTVKEGELLVSIEPRTYEQRVLQAQIDLENTKNSSAQTITSR